MLDHELIEIKGSLLRSKYGVYLIEVNHQTDGTYYYIGQTGDAKVISARSSFYRLAAHLGYRKNTQNQVYEGLKNRTEIADRYDLEVWLEKATVKMHFFKVADFQFMKDTPENKTLHHQKRRKTLALETALLEIGRKKGMVLLNKPGKTYKDFKDQIEEAEKIWNHLNK